MNEMTPVLQDEDEFQIRELTEAELDLIGGGLSAIKIPPAH